MAYSLANFGSIVLLSVDFTGGSLFEIKFLDQAGHIESVLAPYQNTAAPQITQEGATWQVTLGPDTPADVEAKVFAALSAVDPGVLQDGSVFTLTTPGAYNESTEGAIREVFTVGFNLDDPHIQQIGAPAEQRWQIRTSFVEEEQQTQIIDSLEAQIAPVDQGTLRIERVTPTIGTEVTQAAVLAVFVVAVLILVFIAWAFRKVPHFFRYGTCAIIAMFHDVLITLGVMSLLGIFFGWEADSLFLTAVLTVVGYSVQDKIVIFDRIRENLPRRRNEPFETVVNRSLLETVHRSLSTQINAVFVMIAIVLFGGETIRQFIVILLVGLATGTYSSIFTAAPMLVTWEKGEFPILSALRGRTSS